ncbi:MAG: endolytic transglycosylase MltG [Candidatus Paceibacterota bacterium]
MQRNQIYTVLKISAVLVIISSVIVLALPYVFAITINHEQSFSTEMDLFPVTVDSKNKTIVEDAQVNAFLESPSSPLQAAAGNTGETLWEIFAWVAKTINGAPWYQSIAAAGGRFVTITPGMRKEQVADAFAKTLSWNATQKKEFMLATTSSQLPFLEGSFSPGTYVVSTGTTPGDARSLVNDRFTQDVLEHYGTTTAEMVPLDEALIIASLIQRETIGTADMRLVSGVIWNRLFAGMNLQIDATLQYAKANTPETSKWWPKVVPADTRRKSPYNTYLHQGLPPTPIANPSVAAIVAALNPIQTSCLFYFNDNAGDIHCTDTYAQHVALLKKYYGRGK